MNYNEDDFSSHLKIMQKMFSETGLSILYTSHIMSIILLMGEY